MTSESRDERYSRQTKDLYAAYGQYCVAFEHLCGEMHHAIYGVLASQGGLKDQQLHNIVFAGYTAEPLQKTLRALLFHVIKLSGPREKKLKALFNQIKDLIAERNVLVHGRWYIGYASRDQTDFSSAQYVKAKQTGSGVELATGELDANQLQQRTDALNVAAGRIRDLYMGLVFSNGIDAAVDKLPA